MSNPEENQPAKPKGKLSAFFHEHGGTVAAIAGLGAALITVFVVTRGNGGNSTSTTPNTTTSTDGTPISSGTPTTPGQDLTNLQNELATLTQLDTQNQTTLQGILTKLTGGSGTQGTPVTRPPVGIPPPAPPIAVGNRPVQIPAPITNPINTSGSKKGQPIRPTNIATGITPIKHPSARTEQVNTVKENPVTPVHTAPKNVNTGAGKLRPIAQ